MKYKSYIEGKRKGKEASRIEREALKDPLLSEAMEGYEKLGGYPEEDIKTMRQRITTRTQRQRLHIRHIGIAACLFFLLGLGSYFFLKHVEQPLSKDLLSQSEIQEEIMPELSLESIEVPIPVQKEELKQSLSPSPPALRAERQKKELSGTTPQVLSDKVSEEFLQTLPTDAIALKTPTVEDFDSLTRKMKGMIVDENGKYLAGASVYVKNTPSRGIITNLKGEYDIEVNKGDTLVFRYFGYEPQLAMVADKKVLNVIMSVDSNSIRDEVVVSALQTQRKITTLGAISSVDEKLLKIAPMNDSQTSQPLMGKSAYNDYLKENLISLSDESCEKEGEVLLSFYIDSKGRPYDFTMIKSFCEQATQEAIRLIKEGPDWEIGDKKVVWGVMF